MRDNQHIDPTTPDLRAELLARLKKVAPEIFQDGKLDLERLAQLVGDEVASGPERYGLNWPGKRDSIAMLQAPSAATLVPDRQESVDFDNARHVFIEGENLEVLKVIYKAYFGRVKLIYIDPPYNTGNDFIYHDDFSDPLAAYLRQTGQMGADGSMTTSAPETAGRLHSNWLSMMYPRLSMARQMLDEKGVILISINDVEVSNLRQLCDEVFGPENFVAQLIWEKGRKNDAKLFSTGHEYILVYARSLPALKEAGTIWREEKPGAREIWDEYVRLRAFHGKDDFRRIEQDLQAWFAELPRGHPSKKWSRYKRIDANGPWRDRDISWPGGDGPRFDVPHPITSIPCKVPEAGWRYSTLEDLIRDYDLGLVEFRPDHTEPPFRKAHLRPISAELIDENDEEPELEEAPEGEEELALQVRPTVFYKQSQVAVKYLRKLMGAKVFDNPKDHEELSKLFRYIAASDPEPIIMDFFAGSGSSAEATLRLAASGIPGAQFVAVQIPEPVNPKERTGKAALAAGWSTITEITRERLRRVIGSADLSNGGQGMRAFRLARSNTRRWAGVEDKTAAGYVAQMEAFADTLVQGWRPEDVIWEVALREGFPLTSQVVPVEGSPLGSTWRVTDLDQDRSFTICLADAIDLGSIKGLGLTKEQLFVCRDTALDDTAAANLALQCRLKVL